MHPPNRHHTVYSEIGDKVIAHVRSGHFRPGRGQQQVALCRLCPRLCCKTRPRAVDQAKSGKNKIRTSGFLNQYSAPVRDLEKNFFARELKIVLQHNPPNYGRITRRSEPTLWARKRHAVEERANDGNHLLGQRSAAFPSSLSLTSSGAISALSGTNTGQLGAVGRADGLCRP